MRRVGGAEAVESYREQLEAGIITCSGVAIAIGVTLEYVRQLCKRLEIAFVHARSGRKPQFKPPRELKTNGQ